MIASGLATGGARGLADAVIGHVREEHGLGLGLEVAWSAVVHGGAFAPSPTVPGPCPSTDHRSPTTAPTPGSRPRHRCRRPNCAPSWPCLLADGGPRGAGTA
ncbi:hypothetical protein ACRAWF_43075 [Streptomyces sp. L7]